MLYKLHIIHPGVEKSSDRGWHVVLEEGGFISSLGGGGGESFPTHTNLRKGLVRPQRRGLEEPGDLSGGLPRVHCLALGCRVCSQSLPLGWQLPHEWRHMEVSAGVHEDEGGAGALSDGAEDWGC